MRNRAFLDTNILLYAYDARDPHKQSVCRSLIGERAEAGDGVISTQVMQEFFSAATLKLGVAPLSAKAILKTLAVFEIVQVSPALIYDAIDCAVVNNVSFWDGLIVAAAAAAGCSIVYSEDLQAGQKLLGVTVRSPMA